MEPVVSTEPLLQQLLPTSDQYPVCGRYATETGRGETVRAVVLQGSPTRIGLPDMLILETDTHSITL